MLGGRILFGPRSITVLTSLQRLRHQHTREGGISCVNKTPPASGKARLIKEIPVAGSSPAYAALQTEAEKLLEKVNRGQESLTDVLPSSPLYCVEVGKLLALAAHFGATTTTPRVADSLEWVVQYGERSLNSIRQIMSIATPLVNLADGKSSGRTVLWSHLMKPLEGSLRSMADASPSPPSFEDKLQIRAGLLSVFQLLAKILDTNEGNGGATNASEMCKSEREQLRQLEVIMELSTSVLMRVLGAETSSTDPVVELSECASALGALRGLCLEVERVGDEKDKMRLTALYDEWLKHLQFSVKSVSQQSGRKAPIVLQLAQISLQAPSDDIGHRILPLVLQLMPAGVSSSSIKDLCALTQVINRLRQRYGDVVTPVALGRFLEAARPKIFLLSEGSQGNLFRHVESSILMGNLSRWEEQKRIVLPNDLLELLCSRFACHLNLVWMNHLVPFLQGLCRIEHCRKPKGGKSQDSRVVLSTLHLEPYVNLCMQRALHLIREEKASPTEVASSLRAFVELGMNTEQLFLTSETILLSCIDAGKEDLSRSRSLTPEEKKDSSGYLSVVRAVELFSRHVNPTTEEQKRTLERAERVLQALHRHAPSHLREARTPGELISFFTTLVGDPTRKSESLEEEAESTAAEDSGSDPSASGSHDAVDGFLKSVEKLADQCSLSELTTLALGVAQVHAHGAASASAMAALVKQLEAHRGVIPLAELKKMMDAASKMSFVDASPALSSRLLESSLVSSSCGTQSLPAAEGFLLSLPEFAQSCRSVLRFFDAMPVSLQDKLAVTQRMLEQARVLIAPLLNELPLEHRRQQVMTELCFLGFNLSRLYSKMARPDLVETEEVRDNTSAPPENEEEMPKEYLELQRSMQKTFEVLGRVGERVVSGRGLYDAEQHHGGRRLDVEPKKLVMLIQAFENADVTHPTLMYALLHELQQTSHLLDPLELSLVMNASLGQGVWNARVMQNLSAEVERKIQESPLRQCHTILSALERSRFLSPQTYMGDYAVRKTSSTAGRTTSFLSSQTNTPLKTLATAALRRMLTLSSGREKIQQLLAKESFADVMGSLRALAFFNAPPQPLLDTFFLVATKRLVSYSLRLRQRKNGVLLAAAELKSVEQAAIHLLQSVHKVRCLEHQRVASIAIQRSLILLLENFKRSTSLPSTEEAFWQVLSLRELGELIAALQAQQLLYQPRRSARSHATRIRRLCRGLCNAYEAQLTGTTRSTWSQLQYALQPIFSHGSLMDLPMSFFFHSAMVKWTQSIPPSVRDGGAVPSLLVNGLTYHLLRSRSRATRSAAVPDLMELLLQALRAKERNALLLPLDAVAVLQGQSMLVGAHPPFSGSGAVEVLLTSSLGLGTAIEVILAISRLKVQQQWDPALHQLLLRMIEIVFPAISREDFAGHRKLQHIYRLLTVENGFFIRAFITSEPDNSSLRSIATGLLSQALSSIAKAHTGQTSSPSLSKKYCRRVCSCVRSALNLKNVPPNASLAQAMEICEALD